MNIIKIFDHYGEHNNFSHIKLFMSLKNIYIVNKN